MNKRLKELGAYPGNCDQDEDSHDGHHDPWEVDIMVGDNPDGAHEDTVVEADQGDDGNDARSQQGMDNLREIELECKLKSEYTQICTIPGKRCQIGCIPLC